MLLDIDPAIFATADHPTMINLLTMVAKERHDWRPGMSAAEVAYEFVQDLTARQLRVPILAEWAEKAVVEAAQPRARNGSELPVAAINLDDIVEDLQKPAVLVVENRIGDGGFVRAMALALGDDRVTYALHPRRAWLKFCHGGGTGQMPDLAGEECREFGVVARVAVLFDSDRSAQGDPSRNEDKVQLARSQGVRHVHTFTWRMVENYVPFPVWQHHFRHKAEVITRLRALPPHERGYLHLKQRFVGKKGKMPSPLVPASVPLSEADFQELGPDVVAELRQILTMIHEIL